MTAPTVNGIATNQPVQGTNNIGPFASVTITHADGDVYVVLYANQAGQGFFTSESIAASGFTVPFGTDWLEFNGTPEAATAGIRQLVFNPNEGAVPDGVSQTTSFNIHVEVHVGSPSQSAIDETASVTWSEGEAPGDPPVITSNGGGNTALVQLEENVKDVTDINATDANGGALTFGLGGGADDALFKINSNGQLSFKKAPDFENQIDKNKDGIYQVKVKVTDNTGLSDTQTINVNVKDVKGGVIDGTSGVDIVNANRTVPGEPKPTEEGDTIRGKGKDDKLSGLGGADVIFGDAGDDVLKGGDSGFVIVGGDTERGADLLDGGAGNDTADYSDKPALSALGVPVHIVVTLNGDKPVKVFEEFRLSIGVGPALVTRTLEDLIVNIENVTGGAGNDTLTGDGDSNKLLGGAGSDTLRGNGGLDLLDGGAGVDWADLGNETRKLKITADGAIAGDDVIDVFKSIENVVGGSNHDRFVGSSGDNIFYGKGGKDTFVFSGGRDFFDGGATSADTVAYLTATKKVEIDLSDPIGVTDLVDVKVGGQKKDQIVNIENLVGGSAGDVLTGDGLTNLLSGGGGNDRLEGGLGKDFLSGDAQNDWLNGGLGIDVLEGGKGADDFVFDLAPTLKVGGKLTADSNLDTIDDFAQTEGDKIVLDKTIFTKLKGIGADGHLDAKMFRNDVAHKAGNAGKDDFILYGENNTTGILIYDANGNAAGGPGPLVIAFVNKGAGITAADILIEA